MVKHIEDAHFWRAALRIAMFIDFFFFFLAMEWVNIILKHSEFYKLFVCYVELLNPILHKVASGKQTYFDLGYLKAHDGNEGLIMKGCLGGKGTLLHS